MKMIWAIVGRLCSFSGKFSLFKATGRRWNSVVPRSVNRSSLFFWCAAAGVNWVRVCAVSAGTRREWTRMLSAVNREGCM